MLPAPIQNLIDAFSRLPGIGPKTASRLTFYLLKAPQNFADSLASAVEILHTGTGYCEACFNITSAERIVCEICESEDRDGRILCVVEDPMDVLALEKTRGFHGKYHVLHGALSPIEGVGPDDLRIKKLFARVREGEVKEIILATNPSLEGDATAMYLNDQLKSPSVAITRLARGLPVGGDLEYADQGTLLRALAGRQDMD